MIDSDPSDWEILYAGGTPGWDMGAPIGLIPAALEAGLFGQAGSMVSPGGGRGHDAAGFAARGWHASVIDISPTAATYAAEHYPALSYVVGDALDPDFVLASLGGQVDLLWDHTFFCALPPEWRPRVGALAAAAVRPGGLVASGVFPIDRDPSEQGPPWTYVPDDMDAALGSAFERVHLSAPVHLSPRKPWRHRLGIWRRR